MILFLEKKYPSAFSHLMVVNIDLLISWSIIGIMVVTFAWMSHVFLLSQVAVFTLTHLVLLSPALLLGSNISILLYVSPMVLDLVLWPLPHSVNLVKTWWIS